MILGTREPVEFARQVEEHPRLPAGFRAGVRLRGDGLPFGSGHVLGLRRWTASSVGGAFTSIWHRDPAGRWTFQRGIFAIGRVFVTPVPAGVPATVPATEVAR